MSLKKKYVITGKNIRSTHKSGTATSPDCWIQLFFSRAHTNLTHLEFLGKCNSIESIAKASVASTDYNAGNLLSISRSILLVTREHFQLPKVQ